MGSLITLGIDRLDLDWAKNCLGRNHSCLFLPDDLKDVTYHYAENHREQAPAYARSLRTIVKRLALLGYTLDGCRKMYAGLAIHPEYSQRPRVEFKTLANGLGTVDVRRLGMPGGPFGSELWKCVLDGIPKNCQHKSATPSLTRLEFELESFFTTLDPYMVLRLLAENQINLECEVAWRFRDLVEGGWVDEDRLYEPLPASKRFLLVTEGTSDTSILKKSLGIAEPSTADFFEFIDMDENYPFTGTGNVVRFCEGLAKINIQSRVLVILDNDTAGQSAARRLARLRLPPQIRVMLLPKLEKCRRVRTLGPSGESFEDVNGRATAIEAFLDLSYGGVPPPTVRWTSYDERQDAYQGEFVGKDAYVRAFFEGADKNTGYDMSCLKYLWQQILSR